MAFSSRPTSGPAVPHGRAPGLDTDSPIRNREELWAGNRETWRDAFFGRDSLFVWVVTTHRSRRRRYLERLDRYEFVHLRSPREVEAWLAAATSA